MDVNRHASVERSIPALDAPAWRICSDFWPTPPRRTDLERDRHNVRTRLSQLVRRKRPGDAYDEIRGHQQPARNPWLGGHPGVGLRMLGEVRAGRLEDAGAGDSAF